MRMKREDWDAVLATNLTATFVLAQAAIRPMLKQRGRPDHRHQLGRGADGQCRADQLCGVEGRADRVREGAGAGGGLARDHGQRGGARVDRDGYDAGDRATRRRPTGPRRFRWGVSERVDDVAAAVCFLASDEASYITGHVLAVNGGMYM